MPHVIIVRRRRTSATMTRTTHCLWPGCGAELAHDHDAAVCSCHVSSTYRLPHDPLATALVLHLIVAAYPDAVDLCGVLHCTAHELQAPLNRLRRAGYAILGARRGYVYELGLNGDQTRYGSARMKA
jgi:hypothetical protein